MVTFTEQEAIELLKRHRVVDKWVFEARQRRAEFNALVNGVDFSELLIKIEGIETEKRAKSRKKYAKDIRDVFARVFKKRYNVFEAVGGSEITRIDSNTIKQKFEEILSNFKGNKSLEKYLSDCLFNLWDIDPNGIFFIEYITENDELKKIYPTYKSINDIRYYKSNGQLIDFIIFEPKAKEGINYWRFVDGLNDYTFKEVNGIFTLEIEKSFTHKFESVPAVILSDVEKVGSEIRISPVDQISELAKDLARDKSILTIYKAQKGFPLHWRYVQECKTCRGISKDGKKCEDCGGSGILGKNDVTDVINLTIPQEGDPKLAPEIAGFIAPDLDTWTQYNEDVKNFEKLIEATFWGTTETKGNNETATGKFIDTQPITNELSRISSNIEFIHNQLAKFILKALKVTDQSNYIYYRTYGKRFIIDSPDVVMKRYDEARKNGDNTTILDRLLNEWIVSKFKSDNYSLAIQLKKAQVEPYVHYSITEIHAIFGSREAQKKAVFQEWWKDAPHDKSEVELRKQFNDYFNSIAPIENNKGII